MNILGIDTTTKIASCSVLNNKKYYIKSIDNEITHSEKLLPIIDETLIESGTDLDGMNLLACINGPGSFTGLRIGLATIKAFAQVKDLPIFSISSIDLITYTAYEKLKENNKAYINSATSEYNHQTFINYNAPENTYLTKVIPYTAATESTRGFPIDLFKCKYIFVSNVRLESTGATKGEIITNIKYAVEEDEVISKKFELVKTFDVTSKITYYAYERVQPLDEEERQAWLKLFEEQSEKYPDKFKERIENYKI